MMIQSLKTDVVVVGAGCAGMIAALEAAKTGAHVLLLDRGAVGVGTNSAISNGVFAGPSLDYDVDEHIRDTLETGKGLNRRRTVRLIAERAQEAFSLLHSLGIKLAEFRGGYAIKGLTKDTIRGLTLVKMLAAAVGRSASIGTIERFFVTEITTSNGSACGVEGVDSEGRRTAVRSPSVVLATGGAGAIYLRNDNQKRAMGQGYYLAAKAGVKLWDTEFVQFYPLVVAEPGAPSLLVYPPYPDEAHILNCKGEDILQKHGIGDPNAAVEKQRDEFSAILFEEGLQGPVYMDYTRVSASLYAKRPLSLLPRTKIDLARAPFAVSPAAHFFMGGIETDEAAHTSLPGLFACGEAVWGFHGANRMRGNALTECAVTGMIAGREAAASAFSHGPDPVECIHGTEVRSSHSSPNRVDLKDLRHTLKEIAWKHAGVARTEEGLNEGIRRVSEIRVKVAQIEPGSMLDAVGLEDLKSAAFMLRAVLETSLLRKESRGAFIRSDFIRTDNDNWRRNSCLAYDKEEDSFSIKFVGSDQ